MKIVFVLNGIYKSRCLKRVEEFIDNGYQVDVYGYAWDNDIPNVSDKFQIEVIGHQSVHFSYLKRLSIPERVQMILTVILKNTTAHRKGLQTIWKR